MMEKKRTAGRPAGRKKTAKLQIAIEPKIKEEFMEILESEGQNASSQICLWIRAYIKEHTEVLEK